MNHYSFLFLYWLFGSFSDSVLRSRNAVLTYFNGVFSCSAHQAGGVIMNVYFVMEL